MFASTSVWNLHFPIASALLFVFVASLFISRFASFLCFGIDVDMHFYIVSVVVCMDGDLDFVVSCMNGDLDFVVSCMDGDLDFVVFAWTVTWILSFLHGR